MSVTRNYPLADIGDCDFVLNNIEHPEQWWRYEVDILGETEWGDRVYQWRQKFRTYLRWAIDIPAGSTVTSAVVMFNACSTEESTLSFTPTINLIDQDNCLTPDDQMPFLGLPSPGYETRIADNGATLPTYSGSPLPWPITIPWIDGTDYNSVDISSLVQAYIDRTGYAPGQYMGLMIEEGDAAESDVRLAYVIAGETPILTIRYTRWGDRWYKWASSRP